MADGMSFDRYIDNPSGGSVFTNRNIYKNMYRRKFGNVLVREQGQIKYTVYKSGDAFDSYYIHIKVPSEVIDNFYYDVVIRLFTDVNEKKNNANLREYAVQFYSNDPAFVYTFANTFYKRKLFINDLKPKMAKQAIKEKAEIRNPGNNVWYVKSLFFAYLIMEKYSLFQRAMLDQHAKKYKKAELLRNITQAETKIADRQKAQKQLDDEKRKEKERAIIERQKQLRTQQTHSTKIAKATKISKVSTTTKVSKVSKTSKITPKR